MRLPGTSRQHFREPGQGKAARYQSGSNLATRQGWIRARDSISRQWRSKVLRHTSARRGGRRQHRNRHPRQSRICYLAALRNLPKPGPRYLSPGHRPRFPQDPRNLLQHPARYQHRKRHPDRSARFLPSQQSLCKTQRNSDSTARRTSSVATTQQRTPVTPPPSPPSQQTTLSPSSCSATVLLQPSRQANLGKQ